MIVRYFLQPGVRMEKLMDADGNELVEFLPVEPERKKASSIPVGKQTGGPCRETNPLV